MVRNDMQSVLLDDSGSKIGFPEEVSAASVPMLDDLPDLAPSALFGGCPDSHT